MTALIDWSYDLLTEREQRFFESLSVFAGGCTLEAATSVCGRDGEDELDVIDLIASLVRKSLLVAELAGNVQRYRLLESSRQYAKDKLKARGEQEEVARRHAVFFVQLAERLNDAWETTPDREWLAQANVEAENWRAALDWALAKRRDVVLGQRLAGARQVVWRSLSVKEARRWVAAALEVVDETTPSALIARLDLADAALAGSVGERTTSFAAAERALERYRQRGDLVGIAQAQYLAGQSLVIFERFAEAEPLLEQALEAARGLGYKRLAADVLRAMGLARSLVYDFAGSRTAFTEALKLAHAVGAESLAALLTTCLSGDEYDAGDPEASLRLATDAVHAYRRLGPSVLPSLLACMCGIPKALIALGRYEEARAYAREALELAGGIGYPVVVATLLQQLAVLCLLNSHLRGGATSAPFAAAHLFGFVDNCFAKHGIPQKFGLPEYEKALALLRPAIGEQELTRLMTAGAKMTEDEAIAQAHALE